MSERDFVYWFKGFIELNGGVPTELQWQQIKDHLDLVFNKVTPNYPLDITTWPIELDHWSGNPPQFRTFEQFGQKLCFQEPSLDNPNEQYPITC